MGISQEKLKELTQEMPYKWRLQSTKYGKSTIVAYVDNRQVQNRFDEVCGSGNWQNEFKEVKDMLFAGIGILVDRPNGGESWVWKWDTGTEANMEAEKSIVSDSMKRAAVEWGVGRFLYNIKIIELKAVEHKGKEYPADDKGNILWGADKLSEYCNLVITGRKKDLNDEAVKTEAKKNAAKATTAPKESIAKPDSDKGAIQPNTDFDKAENKGDTDARKNALAAYNKLVASEVLKFLIVQKKLTYPTVAAFIEKHDLDQIRSFYTELTTPAKK